ncbi:MAG: phosphate ABC transporter substrate-binding protein [Desulfovibrionaceae bacterium]|nr:phosphate ABC transporter substrate-binding protein [Desulfovibrionaceae bacterium]
MFFPFCLALIGLAFCCQAAFAGDLDAFAGKEGTISIAGGTAHIPVMKDAAKAIMTANPAIRITIAGGGSGVGIQKVGEGLVNIGNSGRKASDAEVSKYGLVMFPFAVDGVATVVHADNPVQGLTGDQVRAIFAGEVSNWKEVGGNDGAINVYARDESSGTRDVFWKKLLKKGTVVTSANVVPSNGAMKLAVSKDPNAIGYVSIGHLDGSVKAPALDGVVVNQEAAKSGQYPVVRKLYMNTKGQPEGIVKSFVEYITGPDCVEYIKSAGYIPF